MKKTTTRMADGRELIYYDEDASPERKAADQRDLPDVSAASELRYDALVDDWVIVASHRQSRTFMPPTSQCPLCPSRGDHRTEIPDSDYDVVVFENRFPSLAMSVTSITDTVDPGEPLFARRAGVGRCEVVCFTSDHQVAFSALEPSRVRTVLDVWADRTGVLGALAEVAHVVPFENRGKAIGVTLSHPHGQIYAYPHIPHRAFRSLVAARRFQDEQGRNLFEDIVAAERRSGVRIILQTGCWTAFVPAAARWPVEIHVYPNWRIPDLPALDERERAEFPAVYLDLLRCCDALFGKPLPDIAGWHQASVEQFRDLAYLRLEVISIQRTADKLKYLAGSESGIGAWINDTTPEHRAEQLRALDV